MKVLINGKWHDLKDILVVSEIVETYTSVKINDPNFGKGTAVAIDGEVIPRSEWSSKKIINNSKVEIVSAASGG